MMDCIIEPHKAYASTCLYDDVTFSLDDWLNLDPHLQKSQPDLDSIFKARLIANPNNGDIGLDEAQYLDCIFTMGGGGGGHKASNGQD